MPKATRVFITYSHDSPEHMHRILAMCDRFRGERAEPRRPERGIAA